MRQNYEINKVAIEKIVNLLETEKAFTEIPPKILDNGAMAMPYIQYDDRILKVFRYVPYYEKDYNKNINKIIEKGIDKLTLKETLQYLTYIYRTERFYEGILKSAIENGTLINLLKHIIKVGK